MGQTTYSCLVAVKHYYMKMNGGNEGKALQGFTSVRDETNFRLPSMYCWVNGETPEEPVWTWWLEQGTLCLTGIESWSFRWPARAIESRHHDKSDGIASREGPQTLARLLKRAFHTTICHVPLGLRLAVGYASFISRPCDSISQIFLRKIGYIQIGHDSLIPKLLV